MASLLRHRTPQVASLSSPATLQFASAVQNEETTSGKSSRYSSNFAHRYPHWSRGIDDSSSGRWKQMLLVTAGFLLLAAPWIRHSSVQWKVSTLHKELMELQQDQRRLQSRLRSQTNTLKQVKAESVQQKNQNVALLGDLKAHGDNFEDFDSEHYAEAENMENAYFKRVDELQNEIQRSSERKLAKQGYDVLGNSNPIRVEITLNKHVANFGNKLVMELGPFNYLGHAIELFLMLVEHKHFYDHLTLMHRSADRAVIHTVPMDSETMQVVSNNFIRSGHPVIGSAENSSPLDIKKEDDFMLHQLAMLEHARDYPVVKYSVLFADRGPHFYINLEETLPVENGDQKETCFGKIVEGQAILDHMVSNHDNNFSGMFMVGIESVKVLKPVDEAVADPRLPPTQKVFSYKPKHEGLAAAAVST